MLLSLSMSISCFFVRDLGLLAWWIPEST